MKTFLTATSLVALCAATGAVFADGPQHEEREVRIIAGDGESRTVEVREGVVFVDGQRIEADDNQVVIIDGDEVIVREGHDGAHMMVFRGHGEEHAERMAEHAARMAERQAHMRVMRVEMDGIEGQVREQLEGALAHLEERHVMHGEDYESLSEEERAELREELAEAREEIREALSELHIEMAEIHEERAEAEAERRHVIIEMREIEREAAREARDGAREVAREARAAAREAREEAMEAMREFHVERRVRRHPGHGEGLEGASQSIRVEEEDNGVRRVWIDGEEQTGDDLTEWLNRLEAGELAGAARGGERHLHRRVMRAGGDDGNSWSFADGGSWVFERGEGGNLVIEMDGETIDLAGLAEGDIERNVFVTRGHGDGAIVIELDGQVIDLDELQDGVTRWEDEDGERVMIIRRHEEHGEQD